MDIHMEMQAVTSDNVRAVGYETATRTMRVQFHNGLIYEYCDVNLPLFEQMLLPHAWGRMGRVVRAHRYRRVAA